MKKTKKKEIKETTTPTGVKKTINTILEGNKSSKFRLTYQRLNEVFEYFGIPYQAKNKDEEKNERVYLLVNQNGQKKRFADMWELATTPILFNVIKRLSKKETENEDNFWKDLLKMNGVKIRRNAESSV